MQNPNKELINKENLIEKIERSGAEILLTLGAGDIGAEVDKIRAYILGSIELILKIYLTY